eukprot:m.61565 g.61565  ORF g.61565 m.61565 type:complete len:56 (+) comp11872_c0_seq1:221-388(+)
MIETNVGKRVVVQGMNVSNAAYRLHAQDVTNTVCFTTSVGSYTHEVYRTAYACAS